MTGNLLFVLAPFAGESATSFLYGFAAANRILSATAEDL
jgi:hypothetical protein